MAEDMPVRIAIFVSYLPPHIGGIETIAEEEIRALRLQGHEVSVITSACGSTSGLYSSDGNYVRRIPAWNYFESKTGSAFPVYTPMLLWHAFKAIRQAQIVHAHDAFYLTSMVAAVWARVLHKPLILTQHVDLVPHPNFLARAAQRLIYATFGDWVLHSSSRIIVLNSRVRSFVEHKGISADRIIFLPNGVNNSRFAPPKDSEKEDLRERYHLPPGNVLALFVGRFVPKKGFKNLLDVELPANVQQVFVGGGRPNGDYRRDHHFLGQISHDEIPEVFKCCDIFVLPSQGEGFPVAVQEAMASGLAVIMTDDPAYDEYYLDSTGITLIEPTADAIAKAIQTLAENADLRDAMGRYSRTYALEWFTLAAHVATLVDIYGSQIRTDPDRVGKVPTTLHRSAGQGRPQALMRASAQQSRGPTVAADGSPDR
jgi:D-inositol-3-phosphate glycosyltransferase